MRISQVKLCFFCTERNLCIITGQLNISYQIIFILQFCANDRDILLKAAKYAEPHCDAIDLNLGCPQAIAKRGHYGAFLQDEWPLIAEIGRSYHNDKM